MELNLDGRNALVCGASRGIGRAVAQALSEAGARVFLVARDAQRLEDTLATLAGTDGRGHGMLAADLGDTGADVVESSSLAWQIREPFSQLQCSGRVIQGIAG